MLRVDGEFVFYVVQHCPVDGTEWATSDLGVFLFGGDPSEEAKETLRRLDKEYDACGKCWQQTGELGTYDEEVAVKLMMLVAQHCKEYIFRVVEVTMSQITKSVCQVQWH